MNSSVGDADSPRALLKRATEVIQQDAQLLILVLEGSLSRGDDDMWSDVDLGLVYPESYRPSAWDRRTLTLNQIGEVLCADDIRDLVPWSCIAFFWRSRLHLTYYTLEEYHGEGQIMYCTVRDLIPTSHSNRTVAMNSAMSPSRFAFWLNRVIVGAHRADTMQVAEARLRLLEIWLWEVARSRSSSFEGLRKADAYLTSDEVKWCNVYLENLHAMQPEPLLTHLVHEYLDLLLSGKNGETAVSDRRFIESLMADALSRE